MIKNISILLFFASFFQVVNGQGMTNERLEDLLTKGCDSVNGYAGYWEIIHKDRQVICLTDETHNRMRFMTPVAEADSLNKELLLDLMTANFHAALDVKYAISRGYLWSVFIHPLKELDDNEVASAMDQVVNLANNYGTSFSSTKMIFGGQVSNTEEKQPLEEDDKPLLQKL